MGWSPVMLTAKPSWETDYPGIPDARYITFSGMAFEVTRSRLTGWYFIDRIDSAGHYLGETTAVRTQKEVRTAVTIWNGRNVVADEALEGDWSGTDSKANGRRVRTRKLVDA